MSAPVTERKRAARAAAVPAQRAAPTAAPRPERGSAARRAYARRDSRLRRLVRGLPDRGTAPAGRAQFTLLVMVLLAVGLVATLWLSTAATADSYALQDARTHARDLSEESERLHREVAVMGSAPELASRAAELGMVPVQDPARLVVAADGSVTVVGEPTEVTVPAPVVPPAPAVVPPDDPEAGGTDAGGPDAEAADREAADGRVPGPGADTAQLTAGGPEDADPVTGGTGAPTGAGTD